MVPLYYLDKYYSKMNIFIQNIFLHIYDYFCRTDSQRGIIDSKDQLLFNFLYKLLICMLNNTSWFIPTIWEGRIAAAHILTVLQSLCSPPHASLLLHVCSVARGGNLFLSLLDVFIGWETRAGDRRAGADWGLGIYSLSTISATVGWVPPPGDQVSPMVIPPYSFSCHGSCEPLLLLLPLGTNAAESIPLMALLAHSTSLMKFLPPDTSV